MSARWSPTIPSPRASSGSEVLDRVGVPLTPARKVFQAVRGPAPRQVLVLHERPHPLGVYANRRDRLDMLLAEQFRAARLVVDVGIHHKGWTKERAIDYLGGSRENAEREVERYMAWPGQALAYKIGQLKFRSLRAKAEAALGPSFDVRAFHDELLADGSLPLTILEAKMDRWIELQKNRRP